MSSWISSPLWPWVTAAIVFLVLHERRLRWRWRFQLPPGPRPLPILGNALDMPKENLGYALSEMARKYGKMVYLDVLGQPMIIVASYKIANELLDKRSANYSNRPTSVMVQLAGLSWVSVLKQYGQEWRQHRRVFHQWFNSEVVVKLQPIQLKITRDLVRRLLDSPQDLLEQLKFSFAATTLRLAYGIVVTEPDDEYYQMIERISVIGENLTVPGRYAVDAIPFLRFLPKWFPGAGFRRYAAESQQEISSIIDKLYNTARTMAEVGTEGDSVVSQLLYKAKSSSSSQEAADLEVLCKAVTATIYTAGSDTTNSAMQAFFLAMALHPDIQKKAQAEIDAVVGVDRLPEFSDRKALPYVNAIVKELLRWHIVAPIGVPHQTISDDDYAGYFIPAGTIITTNLWAMSRDPDVYPDPETFKPERFLDEHGQLDLKAGDPSEFAFGFGRRICPGRHFAEASMFILCASMLYAFNIKPPIDESGQPLKLTYQTSGEGVVSHVVFHEYIMQSRSPQVERLITEDTS
ncbi:cytochrome P450 [Daedaleopsis nitida]|nr:cytochrome P450 [Daedaleopsis nitida]